MVCGLFAHHSLFSGNNEQDRLKLIEVQVPNLIQSANKLSHFSKKIFPNAQMFIATSLIAINFAPGTNLININEDLQAVAFLSKEPKKEILWAIKGPIKKTKFLSDDLERKNIYVAKIKDEVILTNSKDLSQSDPSILLSNFQMKRNQSDEDLTISANPGLFSVLADNYKFQNSELDIVSEEFSNCLIKLNISNEELEVKFNILPKANSIFEKELKLRNNNKLSLKEVIDIYLQIFAKKNDDLSAKKFLDGISSSLSPFFKKAISFKDIEKIFITSFNIDNSTLHGVIKIDRKQMLLLLGEKH
jgi:hypothetical protein